MVVAAKSDEYNIGNERTEHFKWPALSGEQYGKRLFDSEARAAIHTLEAVRQKAARTTYCDMKAFEDVRSIRAAIEDLFEQVAKHAPESLEPQVYRALVKPRAARSRPSSSTAVPILVDPPPECTSATPAATLADLVRPIPAISIKALCHSKMGLEAILGREPCQPSQPSPKRRLKPRKTSPFGRPIKVRPPDHRKGSSSPASPVFPAEKAFEQNDPTVSGRAAAPDIVRPQSRSSRRDPVTPEPQRGSSSPASPAPLAWETLEQNDTEVSARAAAPDVVCLHSRSSRRDLVTPQPQRGSSAPTSPAPFAWEAIEQNDTEVLARPAAPDIIRPQSRLNRPDPRTPEL